MAGLGAGRPSCAVVIRRTRQVRPASSKIASANSAHVQSPSAATWYRPCGRAISSFVASARWPTYVGEPRWSSTTDTSSCCSPSVEHRPDEVLARPAEEPRAAHDPALPHLALAVELRAPVRRDRLRLVRLDVRLALAAVEDVVGREVDDRSPERDDVSRPLDVDERRPLRISLRPVDVGPGGSVENEIRPIVERRRARHVEPSPIARVRLREDLGERRPRAARPRR